MDDNAYQALTLAERVELFTMHGVVAHDFSAYQEWAAVRGLLTEVQIQTMLDMLGMTREDVNIALQCPTEVELQRIIPEVEQMPWRTTYCRIMDEYERSMEIEVADGLQDPDLPLDLTLSLSPFAFWSRERLEKIRHGLSHIQVSDVAIQELLTSLVSTLLSLSIKTLVWELHCFGEEREDGDADSDALFKSFVRTKLMRSEDLRSFYAKYPVIARRLTTKCAQMTEFFTGMLQNLDAEHSELCSLRMLEAQSSLITSFICSQGDVHEQGKSVTIVCFGSMRVVYKPRNLEIGQRYHAFIEYFNSHVKLLDLYACRGLYRQNYTIEEFIDAVTCTSLAEVTDYYRRFGELCAVVFLLGGNDIHFENIIARSSHPVIVDVETLLHPSRLELLDLSNSAFRLAYMEQVDSVTATAMIPILMFARGADAQGIDVSALGGREQVWPHKVLVLKNINTGDMHFEYQEVTTKGSAGNIPMLAGESIDFYQYREAILQGFEQALTFFESDKPRLLSSDGPLAGFKNAQVRIILKSTMNYWRFMELSSHPAYSTSMTDLERMFANAWAYNYRDKRPVVAEVADMLEGDVPFFFCQAGGYDLITSKGLIIEDYLTESPLDRARRRVEELSSRVIAEQRVHMMASLGIYGESTEARIREFGRPVGSPWTTPGSGSEISLQEILAETIRLGEIIMNAALIDRSTGTIAWNCVRENPVGGTWEVAPLDISLSNGLSGLLVFFHKLSRVTGSESHHNSVDMILNSLAQMPSAEAHPGFAGGSSGLLSALSAVAKGGVRTEFLRPLITEHANTLLNSWDKVEALGLLHGVTGIANALLDAYGVTHDSVYLEAVRGCLHKLATADLPNGTASHEFGFGHGVLGQYWVLGKALAYGSHAETEKIHDRLGRHIEQELPRFLTSCSPGFEDGSSGVLLAGCDSLLCEAALTSILQASATQFWDDSLSQGWAGFVLAAGMANASSSELPLSSAHLVAHDLIQRSRENGQYAIPCLEEYPDVGLARGMGGVGLALLDYYTRHAS